MSFRDLPTLADQGRCAQERWLPVVGFDGYEVSDMGRVRRVKPAIGARVGRILRPKLDGGGYPQVGLSVNGRVTTRAIHRLVARAFIGERPDGCEINHKDFCVTNASVANLEYVTHLENVRHTIRAGRSRLPRNAAGDAASAKLVVNDVVAIRRRYAAGEKPRFIARDYGLRSDSISKIARGLSWKKVEVVNGTR